MKKKNKSNSKRKSTEYRYLQIGKVVNDFAHCVICESMDDVTSKKVPSYNCLLFGGEPICMSCCVFEVDCGRGDADLINAICDYLNLEDIDIYNKCMMCQYSNKNNIYTFLFADVYKLCYFVALKDTQPDEEINIDMIKKDGFCTLFNRKCRHGGNVMDCEHGALNNNSLLYMKYMIEKELMLRNAFSDMDFDDDTYYDD